MAIKVAGSTIVDDNLQIQIANLAEIAQTKSESAVDVFVYDTRKDSDGGAWRQRTQGTSWYNETLNTATRGGRKEFPAVAVIVAESGKVTIYDGDDPSMPMWMVFLGGVYQNMIRANEGRSISAVNGTLCNGRDGTMGLSIISFIKDYAELRHVGGNSGPYKGTISERNAQKDFSYGAFASSLSIVDQSVNDIAMTVLPNAPIDPATGLPIPTIAVATDGGVSVIKDDGTVVDITITSPYGIIYNVSFTKDGKIAFVADSTTGRRSFRVHDIPSEDVAITAQLQKQSSLEFYTEGAYYSASQVDIQLAPSSKLAISDITSNKNTRCIGSSSISEWGGLYTIDKATDPSESLHSHTTSTYNTGWMNGDIKLATLSDTDDTDLVGSELVTNGTFDTDINGWTASSNVTLSHSSGNLVIEDNGYAYQVVTTVVGKSYVAEVEVSAVSSNPLGIWELRIGTSDYPPNLHDGPNQTSAGKYVATFTATTTTTFIVLKTHGITGGTQTVSFDNVSVRLAEPDRSVNNNGLQVFGTVQKNPVATGADLVGYGPFDGTNYLMQPYNSDLDFGTGDFCVSGWLKTSDGYGIIFERYNGVSAQGLISVQVYPRSVYGIDFNVGGELLSSTIPVATNNWVNFTCVRRSGVCEVWIDGKLNNTVANTRDITSSLDAYPSRIGVRSDGEQTLEGSLALFRISGTAPTAEQIAKIYRDEKPLFQENAQATLHGTSDAVTALAYDEDTELLHVGTSAGRSVFQGLRRVDNTTDAVGTAISASNGLVVEE